MKNMNTKLTPVAVSITDLIFDPLNPRLVDIKERPPVIPEARFDEDKIQGRLETKLLKGEFEVDLLVDNIRQNGYLKTDRIVVRAWKGASMKYVIIEGNRRVCALKKIVHDHDAGKHTIDDTLRAEISEIEVLQLDETGLTEKERLEAIKILQGIRHLSGTKSWGPYQQADVIAELRANGRSPADAAATMGISTQAANKLWRAHSALQTMSQHKDYGSKVTCDQFSFFVEAMRPAIREWLGWDTAKESFTNEANLEIFYELITEIEPGKPAKIDRAIDLREFADIVAHPTALSHLRAEKGTLSQALLLASPPKFEDFGPAVENAIRVLRELPVEKARELTLGERDFLKELANLVEKTLKANTQLTSN
jgi:hypothetical protein